MKALLKKLVSYLGAILIIAASVAGNNYVYAKDQSIQLEASRYEFGEKSEYEIDSASSDAGIKFTLGTLSVNGNISSTSTKDKISSYTIADDAFFTIDFNYDNALKNASDSDWHICEDSKEKVNNVKLNDDIENGAVILQTSLDGQKYVIENLNIDGIIIWQ